LEASRDTSDWFSDNEQFKFLEGKLKKHEKLGQKCEPLEKKDEEAKIVFRTRCFAWLYH
jgi:hypothetical protein